MFLNPLQGFPHFLGGLLKPNPARRKPLRVEVSHVRYVKKPDRDDIRAKARELCERMGTPVPEVLLP